MRCFGHRGAKGYAPENTMASFQKALSLGVSWIELDIHCINEELVVIHDRPQVNFRELSGGDRVPLLSDVLEALRGKVGINIEIKGTSGSIQLAHALADAGWQSDQLIVSSFNHRELRRFHELSPGVPTGVLYYGLPHSFREDAVRCGAASIHLQLEYVDKEIVQEVHDSGLLLYVYTVNDPADIRRMKSIGVDGVFSDYPDRVLLAA